MRWWMSHLSQGATAQGFQILKPRPWDLLGQIDGFGLGWLMASSLSWHITRTFWCLREGEGAKNMRNTPRHVFLVFSGRKISKHIRDACMCSAGGGRWRGPGHEKHTVSAHFLCLWAGIVVGVVLVVFCVWRSCLDTWWWWCSGGKMGWQHGTRPYRHVLCVQQGVGSGLGGGSPRHDKRACLGTYQRQVLTKHHLPRPLNTSMSACVWG